MKNLFFLECYHQLVMCQTPAPDLDIIWNIQQNSQIQVHFCIGLWTERWEECGFHVPSRWERNSKRQASAGIFPWLVFYQNWCLWVLVLFPSFSFSLLSSVVFVLSPVKMGGQGKSCSHTIRSSSLSQMSDDECGSISGLCVRVIRTVEDTNRDGQMSCLLGHPNLGNEPPLVCFLGLLEQLGLA